MEDKGAYKSLIPKGSRSLMLAVYRGGQHDKKALRKDINSDWEIGY
jgi:hypothetical protein